VALACVQIQGHGKEIDSEEIEATVPIEIALKNLFGDLILESDRRDEAHLRMRWSGT